MPVDRGRLRQLVVDGDAHRLAALEDDRRTGSRVERPGSDLPSSSMKPYAGLVRRAAGVHRATSRSLRRLDVRHGGVASCRKNA